jgi:hypothetical protein
MSMESHGMMMLAGDNAWLVYQSSMAVIPAEISGASRRNGRRSGNFAYQYLKYLKGSLTCCKILRHGTSGFISHPKEGVLRICIALKNPSPRLGLNPRPLGPVASTLTTTPRRRPLNGYWLPDNTDVTGNIRTGQRSNSEERIIIITQVIRIFTNLLLNSQWNVLKFTWGNERKPRLTDIGQHSKVIFWYYNASCAYFLATFDAVSFRGGIAAVAHVGSVAPFLQRISYTGHKGPTVSDIVRRRPWPWPAARLAFIRDLAAVCHYSMTTSLFPESNTQLTQ